MKKFLTILFFMICIIISGCGTSQKEVAKENQILQEQEKQINNRINNFNEQEKIVFNEKFQEYSKTMDESKAKFEAIRDVDVYNSKIEYEKKRAKDIEKSHKELGINKKDIEYIEADINVLINDVKENAARANKSYNGKYVKIVGGIIENIESDGDYIVINNGEIFSLLAVQCFPKK